MIDLIRGLSKFELGGFSLLNDDDAKKYQRPLVCSFE
jgi:hypothetical protein